MNAAAGWFGIGGTSWKEEVRLHDGSKIIVQRSFSRGGGHEPGQRSSIKEQDMTFILPGSDKSITWKSEYSQDIGRANFNLLALHVLNNIPYVVAEPNLCLSYNKWGRPNPPYVIFKYDGTTWLRISIDDLPVEFKEFNVVITVDDQSLFNEIDRHDVITAATIKKLNSALRQQEYKLILREPVIAGLGVSMVNCEKMVYYKCGWAGVSPDGTFNRGFLDRTCK